jgi:ribosome-binding factor A
MSEGRGHRGHKDLQVCRQVFDALSYALAELEDPVISALSLVSVVPAPNASRVQVNFVARTPIDLGEARARLAALAPSLRGEVAAEVTRKRVPELAFHIGYAEGP